MAHREIDRLLLRDTLLQTLGSHLHQQFPRALLTGQVEVAPHHFGQNKLEVKDIRLLQRAPRHQVVGSLRGHLLECRLPHRLSVCHIYIERYGLRTIGHLGVGRHVYRSVYQRLYGIKRDVKLGVISLSRCLVECQVETLDVICVCR